MGGVHSGPPWVSPGGGGLFAAAARGGGSVFDGARPSLNASSTSAFAAAGGATAWARGFLSDPDREEVREGSRGAGVGCLGAEGGLVRGGGWRAGGGSVTATGQIPATIGVVAGGLDRSGAGRSHPSGCWSATQKRSASGAAKVTQGDADHADHGGGGAGGSHVLAASAAASDDARSCRVPSIDTAVQGGGGVVAGTVTAAVLAQAMNPALMAAENSAVLGEVVDIAGQSWMTTSSLMYLIEYFHLTHDMEWWVAIVATTIAMRVFTLPLTIMQQRNAAKLHMAKPEIEAINQQMKLNPSNDPKAIEAHRDRVLEVWKKYDCHPFKMFLPLFVQAPVFISFFYAINRMSDGVPSFKNGGDFWFTDLSVADPTYAMPVLSAATFLLSIELGGVAGAVGGGPTPDQNDNSQVYMKYFMRGLGVAMVPMTASLPSGVFVYWVTTNLFSFGQMMALKLPMFKKLMMIPETPKIPETAAGRKSMVNKFEIEKKFGEAPQLHASNPRVRLYDTPESTQHPFTRPLSPSSAKRERHPADSQLQQTHINDEDKVHR